MLSHATQYNILLDLYFLGKQTHLKARTSVYDLNYSSLLKYTKSRPLSPSLSPTPIKV